MDNQILLGAIPKKKISCMPSIKVIVTRIPAMLTQEGLDNLFRNYEVLGLRLVKNKGRTHGVRGINYAVATFNSKEKAEEAMSKLHKKPPLNLELNFADEILSEFNSATDSNSNRVSSFNREKDTEILKSNVEEHVCVGDHENNVSFTSSQSINALKEGSLVASGEESNDDVFTFGQPLVVDLPDTDLGKCSLCNKDCMVVCSLCHLGYCGVVCQVNDWEKHRYICVEKSSKDLERGEIETCGENIVDSTSSYTTEAIAKKDDDSLNKISPSRSEENEGKVSNFVFPDNWVPVEGISRFTAESKLILDICGHIEISTHIHNIELSVPWSSEVEGVVLQFLGSDGIMARKVGFHDSGAWNIELKDQDGINMAEDLVNVGIFIFSKKPDSVNVTVENNLKKNIDPAPIHKPKMGDQKSYLLLPLRETQNVRILHVEKGGPFFVCPIAAKSKLEKLQKNVQLESEHCQAPSQVVKGGLYYAKRDCDKQWYRAVVLHIQDNILNVYFPDFGIKEKISSSNLRIPIEESRGEYSFFASPCVAVDKRIPGNVNDEVLIKIEKRKDMMNFVKLLS